MVKKSAYIKTIHAYHDGYSHCVVVDCNEIEHKTPYTPTEVKTTFYKEVELCKKNARVLISDLNSISGYKPQD